LDTTGGGAKQKMDTLFQEASLENVLPWDGGKEFVADLDHFVKRPAQHPEHVHTLLNPFHHMMAVYGRKGMGKARGLAEYCKRNNVRHATIQVEFGKTVQAVELIQSHFEQILQNPPPVNTFDVLILDRADLLILNPEHELTMQLMLELKEEAAKHRCMIFACFDRNPMRQAQGALPESTKQFRARAMAQFTVNFYFAYPTSAYRSELISHVWALATQAFPVLQVHLSEEDYTHLETYTSFCSPLEIVQYMRVIVNRALSENRTHPASKNDQDDKVHINIEVMRATLSSATGSLHVLRFDPKVEEDEYCRLCGKGTIPGASKSVAPKPIPLMKKELEETPARKRQKIKRDEEDAKIMDAFKSEPATQKE